MKRKGHILPRAIRYKVDWPSNNNPNSETWLVKEAHRGHCLTVAGHHLSISAFIWMNLVLRLVSAFLQLSGLVFREPRPPLVGIALWQAAQVPVAVLREDGAVEHLEEERLQGQKKNLSKGSYLLSWFKKDKEIAAQVAKHGKFVVVVLGMNPSQKLGFPHLTF